jgi:hypothetical protein
LVSKQQFPNNKIKEKNRTIQESFKTSFYSLGVRIERFNGLFFSQGSGQE